MDGEQVVNLTFDKLYENHQDFRSLKFKKKTRSKSLAFSSCVFEEIGCGLSKRPKSLPFSSNCSEKDFCNNSKYSNEQTHSLEKNRPETFYKPRILKSYSVEKYSRSSDNYGPVPSLSIGKEDVEDDLNNQSYSIGKSGFYFNFLNWSNEGNQSNELYSCSASQIGLSSLDKDSFINRTFELLYKGQKTSEGLKFKKKKKSRALPNNIKGNNTDSLLKNENHGSERLSTKLPLRCEEDSDTDSNKSGIIPVTHRKKSQLSPDKEIFKDKEFNQKLKQRHKSKKEHSPRDTDKKKNRSYYTFSHESTRNSSDRSKYRKRYKYYQYKEKRNLRNNSEISKLKLNESNSYVHVGKITKSHKYYKDRHKVKKLNAVDHNDGVSAVSEGSHHKTHHRSKHKRHDMKTKMSDNCDRHSKLKSNMSRRESKLNKKITEHIIYDKPESNPVESYSDSKVSKSVCRNYRSDKHMKTRGMAKIIIDNQRREKELTTIDQKLQDEILQRHELDIGSSNNGYDCLDVLDERVNLICDDEIALPKSDATEWSNGERQYNLTINNQLEKVLHNGGIWKSITREKI